MNTDYHNMTLEELERLAFQIDDKLALAVLKKIEALLGENNWDRLLRLTKSPTVFVKEPK